MGIGFAYSAHAIDYSTCRSINDVISKETEEIDYMHPADHEGLAQMYVSRGESYLINKDFGRALMDFQKAYSHLEYALDEETLLTIAFRATLGEIVSYDNLGMHENTVQAIRHLQNIVNHFDCDHDINISPCQGRVQLSANKRCADSLVLRTAAVDLNQPQPKWWCEKTVRNTTAILRGIAANIPSSVIRFSALELIKAMEEKALNCCYAGGLWSACVKPLAAKFEQWNYKWKVFGIPPDPAWDSDID